MSYSGSLGSILSSRSSTSRISARFSKTLAPIRSRRLDISRLVSTISFRACSQIGLVSYARISSFCSREFVSTARPSRLCNREFVSSARSSSACSRESTESKRANTLSSKGRLPFIGSVFWSFTTLIIRLLWDPDQVIAFDHNASPITESLLYA